MPRKEVKVIVWLIAIVLSVYGFSRTGLVLDLKSSSHPDTVPDGLLNYGTMGKILKQLGLVQPVPTNGNPWPIKKRQNQRVRAGSAMVRINIETEKKTIFKVYWAETGKPFVEKNSAAIRIRPTKSRYTILVGDLSKIGRFRIDPATTSAKMRFHSIAIKSRMHQNITLNTHDGFKNLKPVYGIRNIVYNGGGMAFETYDKDPKFELAITPERNIETTVFQKKRLKGGYIYTSNPDGFKGFPSSTIIKQDYLNTGWPLLSIVAKDSDLYHPDTGIIVNKMERGKAWERPAYWSFFKDGEVRSAGMAGLRMHGGRSRLQLFNNFRLYFRKEYGISALQHKTFFGTGIKPIKRLVIHSTAWPPAWPFNTPLAYDITRQMGAIAPKTQLSILYLNGKHQGIYFLTPQLGRVQLRAYFGHDDFSLYSFKKKNSKAARTFYNRNFWRHANSVQKLTMKEVGKYIDLENFTRHLFAFVFCGTSDFCQGVAVQDNTKQNGKLFWVNWDMDHSFIDVHRTFYARHLPKRDLWEQRAWTLVYKKKKQMCGRTRLFTRLMDEDPAYRTYVIELVLDLLNHRINERFLTERLQHYRHMLSNYGENQTDYIKGLARFFRHRPAFIRREMKKLFGMEDIAKCEIKGVKGVDYEVDGYVESEGYVGHYRKNSTVKITVQDQTGSEFQHWLVNGEKVEGEQLVHTIKTDTVIESVFSRSY